MTTAFIDATQTWLDRFVIHYSICPFARRERLRNSIRYQVIQGIDLEVHLENLIVEAEYLDRHPDTETTLLIFAEAYSDFDDFLDLMAIADDLLIAQAYEGVYQLASFHPDYCFAEASPDDAANYTNRSPYPMLHLIREASIEQVLRHYPEPEAIPQRNIALTHQLGLSYLQDLLSGCRQRPGTPL